MARRLNLHPQVARPRLPLTAASIKELEKNIRWAIETQPFSDSELQTIIRMGETIAPTWAERYG